MKKHGLHSTGKTIDSINPDNVNEEGWEWFESIEDRDSAIPEPSNNKKIKEVETNRRNAYRNESDPLYLKWQRGEATEQQWLDKIEEIKKRFPKPE